MKRTLRGIAIPWILGILFAAGFLVACQKTDPQMDESTGQAPISKDDLTLIASLGYDTDGIEKVNDGYLVEGDIWLTDEWLEGAKEQKPETRLGQHNRGYLIKSEYQSKLYLDSNNLGIYDANWTNAVFNAMTMWNALDRCNIEIRNGYASDCQEIKIKFEAKSSFENNISKLMKVTPPTYEGKPGTVLINKDCYFLPKFENDTQRIKGISLIMHAIGHSLGLGHATVMGDTTPDDDWSTSISGIDNWPDPTSIMRRETSSLPWNGFSELDVEYLPLIFPIPVVVKLSAGTIEETKLIKREDKKLVINSVTDASGGTGTITYAWERKSGSSWETLYGATGKSLPDASVPQDHKTEYRRKATSGSETAYSNPCVVTNNLMSVGSIEQSLTIDTENPADQITIASLVSAFCPGGTVRYEWEIKVKESWATIPNTNSASLTTAVPMQFTTKYRRKAICAHESLYSNECEVINKPFLSAGKIPELVELNKTRQDRRLIIPSIEEASYPNYRWEMDEGNGWKPYSFIDFGTTTATTKRVTKYRRIVVSPMGEAVSNESTVINYAMQEDLHLGTDMDNPILLGTFGDSFQETLVIDTRGEYFWDSDRATGGGNDAFGEFVLTEPMTVEIVTGATIMHVRLRITKEDDPESDFFFFDITSTPLNYTESYDYAAFPEFDIENQMGVQLQTFELSPGRYAFYVQGSRAYTPQVVNDVICFKIRGKKHAN